MIKRGLEREMEKEIDREREKEREREREIGNQQRDTENERLRVGRED